MTKDELLIKWSEPQPVLDCGHVKLIDVMGDDERIEQVARLSYGKGTRSVSDRRHLLRYLMRHRHTSPFEQAVITLDMKMPIFVARQLIRHRTASYNELSGRYSEMPEEYYIPDESQVCIQSIENKQGRGETLLDADAAEMVDLIDASADNSFRDYSILLSEGVARETARMVLPLSTYTQWCMTINLHNLLHMLALRLDPHAQWETRQYANIIADIVADWVPLTWTAFCDYRINAVTFSSMEIDALRAMLAGQATDLDALSEREKKDFFKKLQLTNED
jgi:thymidylate synthase (FAD)